MIVGSFDASWSSSFTEPRLLTARASWMFQGVWYHPPRSSPNPDASLTRIFSYKSFPVAPMLRHESTMYAPEIPTAALCESRGLCEGRGWSRISILLTLVEIRDHPGPSQ